MHTVHHMPAACCAPTRWPEACRALGHRTLCRALPTGRAVLRRFFEVIELQVCGQGYLTGGLACAARHEFGQHSTAQLQLPPCHLANTPTPDRTSNSLHAPNFV